MKPSPATRPGLAFVVAGRLSMLTGGQLFNRHIIEGLRRSGRPVRVVETADPDAVRQVEALPAGTATVIDEEALPGLAESIPALAGHLRLIAFVHHPISEEYGSPAAELRRLAAIERRLLPRFRGVLCPSRRTAAGVAALGVSADRIAVTPPGTEKPATLPPPRSGPVRRLLYVANLIPRKGHAVLIEALAPLRDLPWQLDCIGALDRDPATADRVRRRVDEHGLGERIRLSGAKPPVEVALAYAAADAFVSSSLHEGYGMAWAEAMAWGLPQVTTTAGAVAEVVPPEAGILVPPGNIEALSTALHRLLTDRRLAASLAMGARAAAQRLPDWPEAVREWATAFDRLAGT